MCLHAAVFENNPGKELYIQKYNFFVRNSGREYCAQKKLCPVCTLCGTKTIPFICLTCDDYVICEAHIKVHAKKERHFLYMDIKGYLYCSKCKDHIYTDFFENLKEAIQTGAEFPAGRNRDKPNIKQHCSKSYEICPYSSFGLKGFVNLNVSCFVNAVSQVLIHTPILKEYFFEDLHKRTDECGDSCIMCGLDELIKTFYSGDMLPMCSTYFLSILVNNPFLSNFTGEFMEDDNMFYFKVLEAVHARLSGNDTNDINCTCLAHQVFYVITEEIKQCKCERLNPKTITFQPTIHVYAQKEGNNVPTLQKCLENITKIEEIAVCMTCEKALYSQTTFQRLPAILCIKISNNERYHVLFTEFPLELNMVPFLSRVCSEIQAKKTLKFKDNLLNDPTLQYVLYAIIEYVAADKETGHYISYINNNGNWYKCDDAKIHTITVADLLKISACVLFYRRQYIEFAT